MAAMLDAAALNAQALQGLSPSEATELAASLLAQLTGAQAQLQAKDAQLAALDEQVARRERELKFKDAKLERLTFQLAQFKAWKFGARTEAMNAEQRRLFEETVAEDEAE